MVRRAVAIIRTNSSGGNSGRPCSGVPSTWASVGLCQAVPIQNRVAPWAWASRAAVTISSVAMSGAGSRPVWVAGRLGGSRRSPRGQPPGFD